MILTVPQARKSLEKENEILRMRLELLLQANHDLGSMFMCLQSSQIALTNSHQKLTKAHNILVKDFKLRSSFKEGRYSELLEVSTKKERQVLMLVGQGIKTRQIASVLEVSVSDIEKHRSNLIRKLDCKNSIGLASWATIAEQFEARA